MRNLLVAPLSALCIIAGASLAGSQIAVADGELNLYSSRHYDTDERLYSDFEAETGIKINRIEDSADTLIERIKSEGTNSPADVLLTVDAGRIWRADDAGILSPVDSEYLKRRIPPHLRHPDDHWHAFSQRARIIFYDKERVDNPPQTYADLADPQYEGMICTRSSSNVYMISLMAAMIDELGEEKAKEWATGMYSNRARDPEGGDTDQLRGIASGQCAIVLSNHYYFARAGRKDVDGLPADVRERIGWVFPNQADHGAHVNVSVGAVLANAPNRDNAVRFLEYLAGDKAQEYFSAGNDEYPAVPGVALSPSIAMLGLFRQDDRNLGILGENHTRAQEIYNEIGYK